MFDDVARNMINEGNLMERCFFTLSKRKFIKAIFWESLVCFVGTEGKLIKRELLFSQQKTSINSFQMQRNRQS